MCAYVVSTLLQDEVKGIFLTLVIKISYILVKSREMLSSTSESSDDEHFVQSKIEETQDEESSPKRYFIHSIKSYNYDV